MPSRTLCGRASACVVFGDFDVDGLTAAALTVRGLRELGGDVDAVVPHRFKDGYGLTPAAVERVLAARPALVVTVDCGISDGEGVRRLVEAGIRVVVTDHHDAAGDVPTGVPVCDPKLRLGDEDEPAGATVALKLVAAVGARLGRADAWRDLVDLAAIGTVGDVMPLLGENRALVAEGMSRIRREPRPWIAALCEAAAVDASRMRAEHVSFWIAPRLNAAGRIADPREALDLLLADDPATCRELARALDGYNRVRQAAEADLAEEAEAQGPRRVARRRAGAGARGRGLARGRARHRRVAYRGPLRRARAAVLHRGRRGARQRPQRRCGGPARRRWRAARTCSRGSADTRRPWA